MNIKKIIWYSLFSKNPHAVGIVEVATDKGTQYFIGTGEGGTSKEDAKTIVKNGFRFYPELFEVEEWK